MMIPIKIFQGSAILLLTRLMAMSLPSSNTGSSGSSRTIEQVVSATKTAKFSRLIGTVDVDGEGTRHSLADVDPFILLDYGEIAHNKMPPFGAHPHRGHSVITILLRGSVCSWDSFRSRDESEVITAPSAYWVDAGSGVFHEEFSVIEDESDAKQHMHIFQLWIGVKEVDRLKPPRVQYDTNLIAQEIKDVDDSEKVIGSAIYYVGGKENKIETIHPITVVHIKQNKGTTYRLPLLLEKADDPTTTHEAGFVVHMKGNPSFGGTTTPKEVMDVLVLSKASGGDTSDDYLEIKTTPDADAEYLVCTGECIGEKWYKKLMANGAVIAATKDEARSFVPKVQAMSAAGLLKKTEEGGGGGEEGSFAPWGMQISSSKKRRLEEEVK